MIHALRDDGKRGFDADPARDVEWYRYDRWTKRGSRFPHRGQRAPGQKHAPSALSQLAYDFQPDAFIGSRDEGDAGHGQASRYPAIIIPCGENAGWACPQ
jgi:hypothetical protein